jgi:MSHA biogenesis protein MshI
VRLLPFSRRSKNTGLRAGVVASDREIAVAVVRRHPGRRPEVLSCITQAASRGFADETFRKLLEQADVGRTPVSAVIDVGHYQIAQVEAPDVPQAEVKQAARWRLRDKFDFPLETAVVDLFDVPVSARRGRARALFAVAANGEAVTAVGDALKEVAPGFDVIDIPELCQRNLSTLLAQDQKGVALLLLRESFAQLVLTRGGLLYLTRRFDFRPRNFDLGDQLSAVQIDPETLALELQRSLDYYESHFDQSAIGDLVIAPGGGSAETLASALSSQTGLRVSTMALDACVDVAPGVSVPQTWLSCLAIGAALRAEAPAA